MQRIDQTSHPPLNPLDLDLRSDIKTYSPTNLYHNDWWFVNNEIEDAPTPGEVAVTREDFEDFIDAFATLKKRLSKTRSARPLDTTVDPEQFDYPQLHPPEDYEESMDTLIEDADEFYGIMPDVVDYEDVKNNLNKVDDGSDYDAD